MRHSNLKYFRKCDGQRGFTLFETLLAIALLAILTGALAGLFGTYDSRQALDKSALAVLTLLEEARANTASGLNASNFGVHLEATKAVLFRGSVYNAADATNETVDFSGAVSLSSLSLAGGGSDVIFGRLTGTTSKNGTATLSTPDSSFSKTITIYATGFSE